MTVQQGDQEFDRLLAEAEARPLVGWDLSLDGRIVTEPMPWDFAALVTARARESPDLLDMGTGGGEWLSNLGFRPARTVATEGWPPNVLIAAHRLRPLGVEVVAVSGAPGNVSQRDDEVNGRLPFADGSFHLISNRHESYVAAEVARVLAPGGRFLTQQVGTGLGADICDLLDLPTSPSSEPAWTRSFAIAQAEAAGLAVQASAEAAPRMTFADAGAFAWYVRVLPWTLPGFVIAAHRPRLAELNARVRAGETLSVRLPHFWLEAVNDGQ